MPRTNLSDQFDAEQRANWKPRIIQRNTFKFVRDDETVIRLHGTDIVIRHKDGSATLHSGGWRTATTKDRMNSNMPAGCSLYREQGLWYVRQHCEGGKTVPYFDGIRVPACFTGPPSKGKRLMEREAKLRDKIKAFVRKLDKLKQLPEPGPGDCWLCSMRTQDGNTLGEATHDADHILSHVKEGYLHGSLILNALKWRGYHNPEFVWSRTNDDLMRGRRDGMLKQIKQTLRRYLYRQLGLVA